MTLSLIVIGLIGVIGYMWASRGFYSALLHMLCVIIAGAIAFAAWEPLAYWILSTASKQYIIDISWGVSLAMPFVVSLILLRLPLDKLLPANVDLDGISNLVGGGACGVVSGVITTGILLLSVGYLRLPTEFVYFKPVQYDSATGGLVHKESLWIPTDRMTAAFYSMVSQRALSTPEPLARWHPDLIDEGPLLRVNFDEGRSKQTIRPKDFEFVGRYTVAQDIRDPKTKDLKIHDLLNDSFSPASNKSAVYLNGERVSPNSYLEGYVLKFHGGAREREGRIIMGSAQVRLICSAPDGSTLGFQPVAMVSQANQTKPDKVDYARWKFESSDAFIASVGGGEDPIMAFEFLVPRGYEAIGLAVRGVRAKWPAQLLNAFPDPAARDKAILDKTLFVKGAVQGGTLDRSKAFVIKTTENSPIVVNDTIGMGTIVKGQEKGLEVDEKNLITGGTGLFRKNEVEGNRGLDRQLQVRAFLKTEDTVIVQVDVSLKSKLSLVYNPAAQAIDRTEAPVLVDQAGVRYRAIGYIYRDSTEVHIRFTPGKEIQSLANEEDLPKGGPSVSRPDQEFILLFRVTQHANLTDFAVGNVSMGRLNPPLKIGAGGSR